MNINQIIGIVIVLILLPLIAYLLSVAVSYMKAKAENIQNQTVKDIVLDAIDTVEQSVTLGRHLLRLCETYVDALKRGGTFTKEAQQAAFEKAAERARELITDEVKAMISATYGDFDKWLETRIEKEVRANKTEKPEADRTVEAATTAASVAATVASTAVQQLAAEASDATPRE